VFCTPQWFLMFSQLVSVIAKTMTGTVEWFSM
jgi:hypothetical protein